MTSGLSRFRVGRNRQMLGVAALLAAAVLDLPWPGGSAASELMVVLDITQSMAVTDRSIDTPEGGRRTVSRLAFAQDRLGALLARLPCGTRVGWGVFSAHRSFVLMAPAEVCANFQELGRTLVHIDSKMAWAGNSEIAKGLDSALLTVKDLAAGTRLVFVTDGQEAPPLNAAHRPGFHTEPGDVPGLILGVGGDEPAPIPRLDPQGRRVGTWRATDVPQVDPRSADAATGVLPRPVVGATPGREHLSALREDYLRLLASETRLAYATLDGVADLKVAVERGDAGAGWRVWPSLRVLAGTLALLALVWIYRPRVAKRRLPRRESNRLGRVTFR